MLLPSPPNQSRHQLWMARLLRFGLRVDDKGEIRVAAVGLDGHGR